MMSFVKYTNARGCVSESMARLSKRRALSVGHQEDLSNKWKRSRHMAGVQFLCGPRQSCCKFAASITCWEQGSSELETKFSHCCFVFFWTSSPQTDVSVPKSMSLWSVKRWSAHQRGIKRSAGTTYFVKSPMLPMVSSCPSRLPNLISAYLLCNYRYSSLDGSAY